jgi:hypothetical protein
MTVPTNPLSDKSPDKITPTKALEPEQIARQQPATSFDSHMRQGAALPAGQSPGAAGAPTPMELGRPVGAPTTPPSLDTLIAQAKGAQNSLGTVGNQIQNPVLKLKRSQTHLLKNKLADANEHINTAAAKLGLPPTEIKSTGQGGHMEKFLSYINAGQDQFSAIQSKLQEMSSSGQQLDAADMMLLQSKLAVAQQEIEYSSTLLAKVVDSIKQLMAVQL